MTLLKYVDTFDSTLLSLFKKFPAREGNGLLVSKKRFLVHKNETCQTTVEAQKKKIAMWSNLVRGLSTRFETGRGMTMLTIRYKNFLFLNRHDAF